MALVYNQHKLIRKEIKHEIEEKKQKINVSEFHWMSLLLHEIEDT